MVSMDASFFSELFKALLFGISFLLGGNVLEYDPNYMVHFKLEHMLKNQKEYIKISGQPLTSSYCVDKVLIQKQKAEVNVKVTLTPYCDNKQINFNTEFEISPFARS